MATELHKLFEDAENPDMTEEKSMELAIREIKHHHREKRQNKNISFE